MPSPGPGGSQSSLAGMVVSWLTSQFSDAGIVSRNGWPRPHQTRLAGLQEGGRPTLHPTPSRCPLTAPQLMRPATAGVRIVLQVLGGGGCRPRAGLMFLSRPQGRRSPICPNASACPALLSTARLYDDRLPQQSFGPHRRPWLRASITLVIGGWGRPILLPAALQLSDRHT